MDEFATFTRSSTVVALTRCQVLGIGTVKPLGRTLGDAPVGRASIRPTPGRRDNKRYFALAASDFETKVRLKAYFATGQDFRAAASG
jgi:hypothetical protein